MKAFSLDLKDMLVLPHILWLLTLACVLQRVLSLPALVRFFDAQPAPRPPTSTDPDRLARLTGGVLRRIYGSGICMERSLILFHLLRRLGHPVRICFGISKHENGLAGHAWLECDGKPLAESAEPTTVYKTVYSYPS